MTEEPDLSWTQRAKQNARADHTSPAANRYLRAVHAVERIERLPREEAEKLLPVAILRADIAREAMKAAVILERMARNAIRDPDHALDAYLEELMQRGYWADVAIATGAEIERLNAPKTKKEQKRPTRLQSLASLHNTALDKISAQEAS